MTKSEDYEVFSKLFEIDPTSKTFLRWRVSRGTKVAAGKEAGWLQKHKDGRLSAMVSFSTNKKSSKKYFCSRIIWLLTHGVWPDGVIDHIDRNPLNNSIENLRDVPIAVNSKNLSKRKTNKSGATGVHFGTNGYSSSYYVASWCDENKRKLKKAFNIEKLGKELAFQLAVEYREKKLKEVGGYTDNHGK